MEEETKNGETIEKKIRFYNLSKEELRLIELSSKLKTESSPYLYGQSASYTTTGSI